MAEETVVPIKVDSDIVAARQQGRALASRVGFSSGEATLIATAISELSRNIVLYAKRRTVAGGAWWWWRATRGQESLMCAVPLRGATPPRVAWGSA